MSNEQLIRSAHIWALVLLVVFGVIVFAGKAETLGDLAQQNQNGNTNTPGNRNSNQNENQNQNVNQNANQNANQTGNANTRNQNSSNSNASGQQAGMAALSSRDRSFLMHAAMGGLMEVELGRMATQQGASDAVKQFGQRMVDDHTKANTELMQLASSKGITLPTEMDEKHRRDVTKLSQLTGAEFDRAYARLMLSDHRKDVSEFEKHSTRGTDADLKAFASRTLPTLREHLEMARALPGNAGRDNRNDNSTRTTNDNRTGNMNSNDNTNRNANGNVNSNRNRNRNSNGNGNRNNNGNGNGNGNSNRP